MTLWSTTTAVWRDGIQSGKTIRERMCYSSILAISVSNGIHVFFTSFPERALHLETFQTVLHSEINADYFLSSFIPSLYQISCNNKNSLFALD
ncbi:hypothetical protein CEXT_194631 [Caerostris extrusa]|uniref:Uncharacterized protein n=1 Tax=Caerostris extrusa TaxID=172846 RepID=A0AAV4XAU7_CAEEX|nr:hypothetical protein CEXT_194631 [Caerostris extrusa]